MKLAKEVFITAWDYLHGKKSYLIALVAIAYGLLYDDKNAVLLGLATFGLRNGMAGEVAELLKRKK